MLKLEECENEFCNIYISTPFISFHMIMKGVCLRLQLMWFEIVPLLFSTLFSLLWNDCKIMPVTKLKMQQPSPSSLSLTSLCANYCNTGSVILCSLTPLFLSLSKDCLHVIFSKGKFNFENKRWLMYLSVHVCFCVVYLGVDNLCMGFGVILCAYVYIWCRYVRLAVKHAFDRMTEFFYVLLQ